MSESRVFPDRSASDTEATELNAPPLATLAAPGPTDGTPRPGSLAERAAAARARAEANVDTLIDVSTYPDILAVRYQAISWPAMTKIRERYAKEKDEGLKELYIACDQLREACVEVVELKPDGTKEVISPKWNARVAEELGIENLPDECTPRQAMIAVFNSDTVLIVNHWNEYLSWRTGIAPDVEREVVRDFGPTV